MTLRRQWLLGAGMLAASAGLGFAWWRRSAGSDPRFEPVAGFWALQWETPSGELIRMDQFRGKPVVLNFWATWCPPCIDELPLINNFFLKNAANGWQVVGLAVDKPSSVQMFLQRLPLQYPVAMAGFSGTELSRRLGNLSGNLPFTVVIASDGSIAYRKMGRVTDEELQACVAVN